MGSLLEQAFGRKSKGQFVEVGAYDGYTYSNTFGLAQAGWRGLYVEPVPEYAAACRSRIRLVPWLRVENVAVGAAPGTTTLIVAGPYSTSFADVADEGSRHSWSKASYQDARSITVPVTTLDILLSRHRVRPGFEVLVVDVEGGEPEVFEGFSLDRWHPQMIVVELTDWHPNVAGNRARHAALYERILRAGYNVAYKDSTNTVLIRDDVGSRGS
jgi:FkbM family methyltransferase